jgi:Acetyltransferase (GNAT) domain
MLKKPIHWQNLPASTLQKDDQLARDWDHLNSERGNLPFLSSDAMASALSLLGLGNERLLVGTQAGTCAAMFLMAPAGRFQWQCFQPSQVPLGAWVALADLDLADLGHNLMRSKLGLCLGMSITQVDPRIAQRLDDRPDSKNSDYIDTGWIDIQGSFEEYWAARGKNLRQNMRKQRVKLQADGVKLCMEVLRDPADMAPAIARYGSLESSGWKAKEGTAVHPDNAQGRYYRELLEHASRRGEAVVYQYLFDDRVVAMNLCLQRDGTLIVLKTTYDESIQGLSPAFLLREAELQELHHKGEIKHLEYFGRFMDWHSKWTDQKRTLYHLTLYRWPFLKKLAEARRKKTENLVKTGAAEVGVSAAADPA